MPQQPFENAGNFKEDVGMFEAATQAAPLQLRIPSVKNIHMALDGSNQDETTRGFAKAIASRLGAPLTEQTAARDSAEILQAMKSQAAELLVIPAPYGSDYNVLGDHSLGSIVDMILLDCPCPILCIRSAMDPGRIQTTLNDVVLPVAVADRAVAEAISWATRLLAPGGRLELLAVADRDMLDEAKHLLQGSASMDAFDSDQLVRALLRDIGGLVAAAQKLGRSSNLTVHVETQVGKFNSTVIRHAHQNDRLLVCSAPRDHNSPAFHRAVDLLLSAKGPVLVV